MSVSRNNSTARDPHRSVLRTDVLDTSLLDRLRARIVEHTHLYAITESTTAQDDLQIAVIPPGEIDWIASVGPIDRHELSSRVERGDKCYGALVDGRLAHFSWVQTSGTHPIDSAGIVKPVGDGAFWIYNCRTSEAHRGLGLYGRTIARIVKDELANGGSTGWIYTSSTNVASQRGIAKAGFIKHKTLRAIRIGRRFHALT